MSLEPLSTANLRAASVALFLCACLSSLRSRVLPRQIRPRVRRLIDYGLLLQPCGARCGKQIVLKVGGAFDVHAGCNPRRRAEDFPFKCSETMSGSVNGFSVIGFLRWCQPASKKNALPEDVVGNDARPYERAQRRTDANDCSIHSDSSRSAAMVRLIAHV